MIIDKTTADWKDVERIKKYLQEGKKISELNLEIASLSHLKYSITGGNKGLHDVRQKYRNWLKYTAVKEYKKEMKA